MMEELQKRDEEKKKKSIEAAKWKEQAIFKKAETLQKKKITVAKRIEKENQFLMNFEDKTKYYTARTKKILAKSAVQPEPDANEEVQLGSDHRMEDVSEDCTSEIIFVTV